MLYLYLVLCVEDLSRTSRRERLDERLTDTASSESSRKPESLELESGDSERTTCDWDAGISARDQGPDSITLWFWTKRPLHSRFQPNPNEVLPF